MQQVTDDVVRRQAGNDTIYTIALSPDGNRLASGSWDNDVALWDVASGRELARFDGGVGRLYSVAFSPDGRRLAYAGNDGSVHVRNAEDATELWQGKSHSGLVYSLQFSADGSLLASGSEDGSICLWDAGSGELQHHIEGHSVYVQAIAFSPDGTLLASGSRDCTLALWDPRTGREQGRIEVVTNGINSIAFSADGKQVLLSNVDGSVGLWGLASRALTLEMTGHRYPSWSAVFHPVGSADKTVIFWDPQTGAERKRLEGHDKDVYSIAFSPDGGLLFSGSADGSIRVWPLDVTAEQWQPMAAAWREADAEDRTRREKEQAAAVPVKKSKGLFGRLFGS